jgi:CBS domain-containing protein
MRSGISVGDLMTRSFVYVSPETDLKQCARTLVKKRVGSLIVKGKGKLMGIVTEKDIIWAIVKKSVKELDNILAKDIAKRKVITIKPSVDIIEALQKMKKEKVRRLPVLENSKVIGMLTLKDILKIDSSLYELISENAKINEESEKLNLGSKINSKRKKGLCEECGEQDVLYEVDERWVCIPCYNKI